MADAVLPRNARAEAQELVGPDLAPAVLEPSPPAVASEPYADDPVAAVAADQAGTGNRPSLVPAGLPGAVTWDQWLAEHPDQAGWVAERWLGGPRSLPAVPSGLAATREALHRLATYVIAPTRHAATGRFGLRWTLGGFGTPFFADDRQIRVAGTTLIDQRAGQVAAVPITTLAGAADFLATAIDATTAAEHDSPGLGDIDADLRIDADASAFLGAWFGLGFAALEVLRADGGSVDPSRPQLWPGHFDPAIEVGDGDHRASYGASPGDHTIDEPYLYVSLWWPDRLGLTGDALDRSWWNAPSFTGRVLRLSDFPADHDPADTAARFFIETRDAGAAR